MGDDNTMDSNVFGLDLNEEPMDFPLPSILFNEFGTTHVTIEERLRHLEGVTNRARQQRQEQNSTEINHFSDETQVNLDAETGILDDDLIDRTAEKGKGRKRDSSHLVAKALKMEAEVKKNAVDKEGGSFYDCNICLELAKEPILTCCGHLFCWACFYQVSDVDSTSKECPVCKGEVSDGTVIPIYGNGDSESMCETVDGLIIPPRPKARRVESARQRRVNRGISHGMSHVPVAEALRRIRMSIGGGAVDMERQTAESTTAGSGHVRHHQASRVLTESVASLSSLSSALNNAERLVEDLETVIVNRLPGDGGNRVILDPGGAEYNDVVSYSRVNMNAAALPAGTSELVRSSDDRTSTSAASHRYSLRRRNVSSRTMDSRRRRRLND